MKARNLILPAIAVFALASCETTIDLDTAKTRLNAMSEHVEDPTFELPTDFRATGTIHSDYQGVKTELSSEIIFYPSKQFVAATVDGIQNNQKATMSTYIYVQGNQLITAMDMGEQNRFYTVLAQNSDTEALKKIYNEALSQSTLGDSLTGVIKENYAMLESIFEAADGGELDEEITSIDVKVSSKNESHLKVVAKLEGTSDGDEMYQEATIEIDNYLPVYESSFAKVNGEDVGRSESKITYGVGSFSYPDLTGWTEMKA